ncbi:uncharacterized protein DUF1173 [Paraburkholderia sp. BL18I3N2]|uniref:DUF1173 domain-containing protein n=1 Tax=unclassified Paraburkholderia TaxID=2615204 RepID=UPI000D07778D|nr:MULTISPECIES: DUF1173 domain-containing protein [unclassified Paraburkholderia]PRX23973.1 uncharacterized protein DUF1173 [Paraburkholderia sp. BL18I3N2]PRX95951.1 uncharacterized protein DUF1173 [Paraburkholderia sp. BL25I1N1]TDY15675.1 uncharacterized protein DUF1173 [Paraburkholderia sp. BL6665CI2N2]
MSEFRFDDVIVAADAGDLQTYLADAHGEKVRPLCMCTPVGVPMYVAKVGAHYVIKRMPNTGGAHAPDCASYEPPAELSGLGEVKGEAIRENIEDGITTLRLDFSLSKSGGKTAAAPSGVAADTVRTDGAKLTLRGTLHYLWEEAGLNRWYPAMEGKRRWYVVRKFLLQAAAGKVSRGEPLGRSLYVPESFSLEHAEGIAQRRIAHMAELAINRKARKLMIAIGEVKEIVESRYGFKIVAKHLPDFPFMLSEDLHRRLQKRFANELALWDSIEEAHLVLIATFGLSPTGIATIETLALMVVSSNWIPFEHAYDKLMLDALTAHKRRFVKGLRYNLEENKPLACAVLADVLPKPVALYVQPPGVEQEDEDALSSLLDNSDMPSWIWRAGEEMPELPPPSLGQATKPLGRPADALDEVYASAGASSSKQETAR